MAGKIENIVDLGLVNYVRHPSNPDYVVFRFADEKRANDFEQTLKSKEIWFEKAHEEKKNRTYTLFGIHHKDFDAAQKINYAVEGRNRNFIISNKILRWSLLVFFFTAVILAFIGYC